REPPRRQLPPPGSRVPRVELAVHDAVEAERDEPRAGEGEHHQAERSPGERRLARRYEHPEQREGQREHGMRQFDEIRVPDEEALAPERLPLTRRGGQSRAPSTS